MNNITVLLVKPKRKPEVVEIEDTLESLQKNGKRQNRSCLSI